MHNALNPENLSRPEAYTDKKFRIRYMAAIKRRGICAFCVCRDTTFGVVHCKGYPDRQMGMCQDDGKLPTFRIDETTLEGLRDAA